MNKAEPAILAILLGAVLVTLAVRLSLGKYLSASMETLDCRLGYYGLMSVASHYPRAAVKEVDGWTLVTFRDGHFLFSKPGGQGHPMAVLRKVEEVQGRAKVVSEGCAFGDKEAYRAAMEKLPPIAAIIPEVPAAAGPAKVENR
jgi:hypothetical protein